MKKCFLSFIFCFLFLLSRAEYSRVSFYIVAHQDDWQLFMGYNAYHDISDKNSKTVFIYTTSGNAGIIGDNGHGEGHGNCGDCSMPYFKSRELGAISSIQLVLPPSKVYKWCNCWPYPKMTEVIFNANGKKWYVKKYIYCNTVSYFLRIADASLAALQNGESAVTSKEDSTDHQNEFRSDKDLSALLNSIITYEKGTFDSFWLNTHEVDQKINPNDHSDHLCTGRICREATKGMKVNFNYFIGYHSTELGANLSTEAAVIEAGLLAAYNKAKLDAGWWDDWEESKLWCESNYNREVLYSREPEKPKEQLPINLFNYLILIPVLIIWGMIFKEVFGKKTVKS
jgi:hypothetical protein